MQELIEEVVRWFGYVVLKALTFGSYTGGGSSDRLPEGACGLGVIALVTYLVVRWSA